MHAIVHSADIQDRDGGALLMASLFGAFPFLIKLYADGGYQGPEFQSAMKRILARVTVEIVKRSDQATGFVALPKRWIVERTFAWLGRCRRLAKDWECLNNRALAFLPRLHPPHAAKTMQSRIMFSDRPGSIMPSKPAERLDRRDFMVASVATIGASAALVADADSSSAQESATSSVRPVPGAPSATVYTGDRIQGKRSSARLISTTWSLGRSTCCIFLASRCPPDSAGTYR